MPDTQLVAHELIPSARRPPVGGSVVLSFDIEEHDRIEAAAALGRPATTRAEYADRMERTTDRLLDLLAESGVPATFYVVGEIAWSHPRLVRRIADAGHELGSHGWDHRRCHAFTPTTFRDDIRRTVDALEQVTGEAVAGHRAPTFSVVSQTAWALDVLADCGLRYDTSVFPVRHDRYGVPAAPRTPFVAEGPGGSGIVELPPATWRVCGQNLPVAGGGYFRLFPPAAMNAGISQLLAEPGGVAMLYFHPWEFDADQPRLPLGRFARWRTYVGVGKSLGRLRRLIETHRNRCRRAVDVVEELDVAKLPRFRVS